jgi:hypothetical protein
MSISALPDPGRSPNTGFRHEALIYRSDQEFLDVVVPSLGEGIAARGPTLLAVNPRLAQQVAAPLDDSGGLSFLPGGEYSSPRRRPRANYDLFAHTSPPSHADPCGRRGPPPRHRRNLGRVGALDANRQRRGSHGRAMPAPPVAVRSESAAAIASVG